MERGHPVRLSAQLELAWFCNSIVMSVLRTPADRMTALHLVRSLHLKLSAFDLCRDFTQRNKSNVFRLGRLADKSFDGRQVANVFWVICENDRQLRQARFTRAGSDR